MTEGEKPAFASMTSSANGTRWIQEGLTKREHFAAMAMQGLLSNIIYHNPNEGRKMIKVSALAETATTYADALIAALNTTH